MRILMVCLGNICRSPMAEGLLTTYARAENLPWEVESAGTGSWHVGEQPDRRAIDTCRRHGIDIRSQRARQFSRNDFSEFDYILTMDDANYTDVLRQARNTEEEKKVRRLTDFGNGKYSVVPDPYFDGSFEEVFTILSELCSDVLQALQREDGHL